MGIGGLWGLYTLLLLIIFVGIWFWAWSSKRKKGFDDAAHLPLVGDEPVDRHTEQTEKRQ